MGLYGLGPNIHWTSNYVTGIVIYWKYVVLAEFLQFCMVKFKCSYFNFSPNIRDLFSKSNRTI